MKKDGYYKTTNLEVSAYLLCKGKKIIHQETSKGGKTAFCFDGPRSEVEKLVSDFHNNEQVEGKRLMDCYRTAKSLAMPDRPGFNH